MCEEMESLARLILNEIKPLRKSPELEKWIKSKLALPFPFPHTKWDELRSSTLNKIFWERRQSPGTLAKTHATSGGHDIRLRQQQPWMDHKTKPSGAWRRGNNLRPDSMTNGSKSNPHYISTNRKSDLSYPSMIRVKRNIWQVPKPTDSKGEKREKRHGRT